MKRLLIIITVIILGTLILCNSMYFEKLDAKKQKEMVKNFNPKELVAYFWQNKLDDVLKTALDLNTFDSLLIANPLMLKDRYGKSVGITSSYNYLVHGLTKYTKSVSDKIPVELNGNAHYSLLVKYIFNNTARDAIGYFKVSDFENSVDFNAISSEINALIQKELIDKKLDSLKLGTVLKFTGAVEVNSEAISNDLDIVPLKIEIMQ